LAELKQAQLESAEKLLAFTWFVREQPNLIAALGWASLSDPPGAQHLAALLHQNWHRYGIHKFCQGPIP
jgi:hypothetical protein